MPKEKETKDPIDDKINIGLKIIETKKLSWRDIQMFQPKGFKIGNTDGLRKSIANNELLDRFKVFQVAGMKQAKGKEKYFMFDGHTRHKVMLEMEADDLYKFPYEIDCDVLEFIDKKNAAITLLEYQSGKLKISEIGLIEFAEQVKDENEKLISILDEYGIDMIHDKGMTENELKDFFTEDDGSVRGVGDKKKITLEYTDEDYEKVIAAFEKQKGTKEQIVFKLLGCV